MANTVRAPTEEEIAFYLTFADALDSDEAEDELKPQLSEIIANLLVMIGDADVTLRGKAALSLHDAVQIFEEDLSQAQLETILQRLILALDEEDVVVLERFLAAAVISFSSLRDLHGDSGLVKSVAMRIVQKCMHQIVPPVVGAKPVLSQNSTNYGEVICTLIPELDAPVILQLADTVFPITRTRVEVAKVCKDVPEWCIIICSEAARSLQQATPPRAAAAALDFSIKILQLEEPDERILCETFLLIGSIVVYNVETASPYANKIVSLVVPYISHTNECGATACGLLTEVFMNFGAAEPFPQTPFIVSTLAATMEANATNSVYCNAAVQLLGDVAMGIGERFAPHLAVAMAAIGKYGEAGKAIRIAGNDDEEEVAEAHVRRDHTLGSYTTVMMGFVGSSPHPMSPYIGNLLQYINFCLRDIPSDRCLEVAWGLVGDLLRAVGPQKISSEHRKLLHELEPFLQQALVNPSENVQTTAQFAQQALRHL